MGSSARRLFFFTVLYAILNENYSSGAGSAGSSLGILYTGFHVLGQTYFPHLPLA